METNICAHCVYGIPDEKKCYRSSWSKCQGKLFDNDETVELRKDKKRIDWLADSEQMIGNVQLPAKCVGDNIDSLRAAIDCAMNLEI